MGAEVLRGDLNDTDVLRAGTLDSDGVIHLAFVVPSVSEAATRTDAKAIETLATGLAGSGKPLVISGATLVTPGRPATERDELIAAGPSRPASPTCRPPSLRRQGRPLLPGHAAPLGARPGRTPRLHPPAHRRGPG